MYSILWNDKSTTLVPTLDEAQKSVRQMFPHYDIEFVSVGNIIECRKSFASKALGVAAYIKKVAISANI